jgi:hypothetical protein
MLGAELTQYFMSDEAHKDHFIGVLGANEVKKMLKHAGDRSFCVVNVSKTSQLPGTHWYCIFKGGMRAVTTSCMY